MYILVAVLIFAGTFTLSEIAQQNSEVKFDFVYDTVEHIRSLYIENQQPNDPGFNMVDLLGLGGNHRELLKDKISLRSSASKFLLEVYNDITENKHELDHLREHLTHGSRQKRALSEENFITQFDRMEIKKCNNIITFSGKETLSTNNQQLIPDIPIVTNMEIGFNTNYVPRDLKLVHATLKIYQQPRYGKFVLDSSTQVVTVSIYQKGMYHQENTGGLRIISSVNTTTSYKGWLEFNVTGVLNYWLEQNYVRMNALIVGITLNMDNSVYKKNCVNILASDLGLIKPGFSEDIIDLNPFIIGYFNGPELMAKIKKLRLKRDITKGKKSLTNKPPSPAFLQEINKFSKTCQRLNFTINFADLKMDAWIIAPDKFEAYFCGGECNFPLDSNMNATNHAIMQTLIHLKQPNIPKPCCIPTVLGSILILHYINNDTVNLVIYKQIVAKECGCH